MDDFEITKEAILSCADLPGIVRENIDSIDRLEITKFDSTYIEFLDEQIALKARGEQWTERLKNRRRSLVDYIDVPLLSAKLKVGEEEFSLKMEPKLKSVIHWERY